MPSLDTRVPPPVVMLVAGAFAWGLSRLTPGLGFVFPAQALAGGLLAITGIAIAVAGILAFRRARTTVSPLKPSAATALVQTGIYRWTRNPMYLGMAILLLGWTLVIGHPAGLAGAALFILYIDRFQIRPEEHALTELFGGAFVEYSKRVRRWL